TQFAAVPLNLLVCFVCCSPLHWQRRAHRHTRTRRRTRRPRATPSRAAGLKAQPKRLFGILCVGQQMRCVSFTCAKAGKYCDVDVVCNTASGKFTQLPAQGTFNTEVRTRHKPTTHTRTHTEQTNSGVFLLLCE